MPLRKFGPPIPKPGPVNHLLQGFEPSQSGPAPVTAPAEVRVPLNLIGRYSTGTRTKSENNMINTDSKTKQRLVQGLAARVQMVTIQILQQSVPRCHKRREDVFILTSILTQEIVAFDCQVCHDVVLEASWQKHFSVILRTKHSI